MNASALLADLRRRGAVVRADRGDVVVSAPKGVVTAEDRATLVAAMQELLELLLPDCSGPFSPLVEYAASVLPRIKLTIRETGDTRRDFDLIGRRSSAGQEFQPGGNHIRLSIVTLDKRRVRVGWRALAARELRLALAQVLANAATTGASL